MLLAVLVTLSLACFQAQADMHELLDYNPVASGASVVVSGRARFTMLTPRLIRIEYSAGAFEDRASFAVVHRALAPFSFTQSTSAGWLTIRTPALELRYQIGQTFSQSTLTITNVNATSSFKSWGFGEQDTGNLLGTIRSLDEIGGPISLNCTENANKYVHDESLHCEWAIISRNGWAVFNDTANIMFDNTTGYLHQRSPRNTDLVDVYFFGHGMDYRGALYDFQQIGGKIALTPRYAAGIMWTRWYDLSTHDVRKIVEDYESRALPLDVFIIDMDWHPLPWTGYSWDKHLFPYPADMMSWLSRKGLHMAANLHDDSGVAPFEDQYVTMAKANNVNPDSKQPVAFNAIDSRYMFTLDDVVLGAIEQTGMNFWWIDWQQGEREGHCAGGKFNPTILLNQLRATDSMRRQVNSRSFILSRFGGMGNHRYQVGFSGDVDHSWSSLAFQPYYSLTGSNVGYGFWSHDIIAAGADHEMHTRWIQFGAFSAVFRSHDAGASAGICNDFNPAVCSIVEVWNVPTKNFEANRQAMQDRSALIPHLYTLYREAFDTGVSPIRPMYYDYPDQPDAYLADPLGNFAQYLLGSDMLVAPVVNPVNATDQMAKKTVWIPSGSWYERDTGDIHTGPSRLTKSYDLSEIPIFIKAGAIIVTVPVVIGDTIGTAQRQYNHLIASIYPNAMSGSTRIYEDDGKSLSYLNDAFMWTSISYVRIDQRVEIHVSSTGKGYPDFPSSRAWTFALFASTPATAVSAAGTQIRYSRFGGPDTWTYEGLTQRLVIELSNRPTNAILTVTVDTVASQLPLTGMYGAIKHAIMCKSSLDEDRTSVASIESITDLSTTGERFSVLAGGNPADFLAAVYGMGLLFEKALVEVNNLNPIPFDPNTITQHYNADRKDTVLCGSQACRDTNDEDAGYTFQRIEGYGLIAPNATGAVNLYCYWSEANQDNYVTTDNNIPAGYGRCAWPDGIVLNYKAAGTVPLRLFISADGKHHLTTATSDGATWAKNHGYTESTVGVLGYVYQFKPHAESPIRHTAPVRQEYCRSLFNNVAT